jgi:hypothetical protein
MKFLYTLTLFLAIPFSVQAQTVLPKVSHFSAQQFSVETELFTASITGDAHTTLYDTNIGFQEQKWPRGDEELLGRSPTAQRFGLVMGGEEFFCELASFKLEHSNHRLFRATGHMIMYGGASLHIYGLGNKLILPRSK